jgi:hypothetical protein
MLKVIVSVLVMVSCVGCAQLDKTNVSSKPLFSDSAKPPIAYALTDSVTTAIAIGSGAAREANPLVNTSPAGLAGLFILKTGMVYYLDKQPAPIREKGLKLNSGLWAGVSVSNLLVIAGATNPLALAGGVIGGVGAYYYEENLLENEKLFKKANLPPSVVITKRYVETKQEPRLVITKKYKDETGIAMLTTTRKIY